jgi:hypothetical protein
MRIPLDRVDTFVGQGERIAPTRGARNDGRCRDPSLE